MQNTAVPTDIPIMEAILRVGESSVEREITKISERLFFLKKGNETIKKFSTQHWKDRIHFYCF